MLVSLVALCAAAKPMDGKYNGVGVHLALVHNSASTEDAYYLVRGWGKDGWSVEN